MLPIQISNILSLSYLRNTDIPSCILWITDVEKLRKGRGTCRSFDLIRPIAKARRSDQMSINCFASKSKGCDISVACCSWHLGSIEIQNKHMPLLKTMINITFPRFYAYSMQKMFIFCFKQQSIYTTSQKINWNVEYNSSSACTLRLVKLHIVFWYMR